MPEGSLHAGFQIGQSIASALDFGTDHAGTHQRRGTREATRMALQILEQRTWQTSCV
jgi:hypothetical protein